MPPGWESIPGPLKRFANTGSDQRLLCCFYSLRSPLCPSYNSLSFPPGGGPLQMLLTPTLNLLLACPKIWPLGQHLGPYRKIRKVNHLYRKFGPLKNFFAKKILKNLTSGLKKKNTIY